MLRSCWRSFILFAINIVLSAYQILLIRFLFTLMPFLIFPSASSNIFSEYRLNKRSERTHPCRTPLQILTTSLSRSWSGPFGCSIIFLYIECLFDLFPFSWESPWVYDVVLCQKPSCSRWNTSTHPSFNYNSSAPKSILPLVPISCPV